MNHGAGGYGIAQSWRSTGDHTGTWQSTKEIIRESAAIPAKYSGKPYGWNDMDMLETGNYAQAAHANGKESNMTAEEYRTEFSMWAISCEPARCDNAHHELLLRESGSVSRRKVRAMDLGSSKRDPFQR